MESSHADLLTEKYIEINESWNNLLCYELPFRNNQDGIYPLKFYGDVDHLHYHDHQGEFYVYQHDHVQHKRVHASFCYDVIWLAVFLRKKIQVVRIICNNKIWKEATWRKALTIFNHKQSQFWLPIFTKPPTPLKLLGFTSVG